MTFAWPHLLWLALVPLGFLIWELTHRRGAASLGYSKILRAEAGRNSLRLTGSSSELVTTRSRVRPWLWCGLIFGIVALARPQWGRLEEPVFDQAREIIIAIDLSRSMLTPDVRPSRLDRAKLLTQSLLEKLQGERIGLIVFSGTAFLQSPLSADYEILREFLPALNPEFLPEGGTNYGALIDTALGAFASTAAADRFLIVLSDGEATDDNWRHRLDELKQKGIRVIGLGVGTGAGAMIPDGSGGFVKDERGAVVMSKLESGTLRELAEKTNGIYQDASNWVDLAALVNSTVEAGRKGQFLEKNTVRLVERFQWPLALALWFLLVSFYYEFPVKPKPRPLKLTGPTTAPQKTSAPTATVTALLVVGLVVMTSKGFGADADPSGGQTPLLAKIVGRLSTAEQQTARDWSEFARETVTWGSRLQSSQQPVPEGPVHDALTAVDRGSKMDSGATDWSKLRQELEALLQKPPEQKKPDEKKQQDPDQQKSDQQKSEQQKQDSEKKDKDDQQKDPSQKDSSQQPKPDEQQPPKPQDAQKKENDSAFGDMKDKTPPSPEETQKVGGVPEKKDAQKAPEDPALAIPLQKLEQLKNNDSPAELFKLMEGQKDQPQKKTKKDW